MIFRQFFSKISFGGFILIVCWTGTSKAQTKIQPPPTRIDIPFDTLRTRTSDAEKMASEKTELELPDVMIFGVDQSSRQTGLKQTPPIVSVESIGIQSLYQPIEISLRARNKPERYEKQPVNNIQAAVLAGSYGHVNLKALYRHPIEKGGAYGFFDYERWDGQFSNSNFNHGMVKISGNYAFSPTSAGNAHLSYINESYGLHGAKLQSGKYQSDAIKFAAQLQHGFSPLVIGDLNLTFANSNGKFDTSRTLEQSADFWFVLNPCLQFRFKKVNLSASLEFMNEVINFNDTTESGKNSVLETKIRASHQLSKRWMLSGGIGWQSLTSELDSNQRFFWTETRLIVTPSHRFGAAISAHSGFDYYTLTALRALNPFMKNQVSLIPERTRIGFQAVVEAAPAFTTKLYARLNRRYADDVRFWLQDSVSQLFDQGYLNDMILTDIEAGASLVIAQKCQLTASFITYSEKIRHKKTIRIDRLPYRPQYRLPVYLSVDLPMQTSLMISGILVGPRQVDLSSSQELNTYFDFSIGLTKQIGRHFSMSLYGKNLLNDNFQIWQHYPETGTRILVQLKAQF